MSASSPSQFGQGARRTALIGCLTLAALATCGLSACGSDRGAGTGESEPTADVSRPQGLLEWMADHPENAAMVALPDRGEAPIEFGGDRAFPLASTRKVLIVGALTASGEDLRTRIPRAKVERFYSPGTDAGAHEKAGLDRPRLPLGAVAQAAIEASDNAAADALLEHVGSGAVDAFASEQGLSGQDPIYPLLGEYAAWGRDPGWAGRSAAERAKRAARLAGRLTGREVSMDVPAPDAQRRLAAASVAGVPAEWAALMRRIGTGGDRELIELLDWPRRRHEEVRRGFERFLTKGGSLPGVLTEASYLKPRGGEGLAVALFLRDLPPEIESTLAKTFTQQQLIEKLATDAGFRGRARELLAGAEPPSDP